MLNEHSGKALERTERSAVNHHGHLLGVVLGCVFELEAGGQVIVDLDSAQLPTAADGILDHEVELRTIERSLAILNLGIKALLGASLLDSGFTLFPNFVRANVLLLVVRVTETNLGLEVIKLENFEHGLDDIHHAQELAFDLVGTAEDMGIVLSKRAYTGKSMQLTALLITINGTELSYTQWQVLVRAWFAGKNLTVMRTVHRLEHVLFILLGSVDGLEAVLTIMGVVSRGHIKILGTNVGSDNLLITEALLYLAEHILQAQTQVGTLGEPHGKSLAHTVGEEEELHLLTNLAVVAFLGLFKHNEILIEHLLLGE